MPEPRSGQNAPEKHEHFDLGVDTLASGSEIGDMHDPWSSGPAPEAPHASGAQLHVPDGDMAPWADSLQLPGM